MGADCLADLKACAGHELAEVRKQAQEQQQQSSNEAQVKLAAAHSARDKLQGQVEQLQNSNGALHHQLGDAHGKVCSICHHAATQFTALPCVCPCESRLQQHAMLETSHKARWRRCGSKNRQCSAAS